MTTSVNRLMAIAVVALLWLTGCDRHIASRDPVRSLPGRPPAPVNLSAQINDRSITVSWEVSDSTAVARFYVYRADAEEGDFRLLDSTADFSLLITGLPFDRAVWLRVSAVGSTGMEGTASEAVSVRAGLLSMIIEDDDEYTNLRDVYILLSVPAPAAYVELSEDVQFGDAIPRQYHSTMTFELSPGDGEKTVYARVTFEDGSIAGEIISDTIVLDTEAYIDSVFFAPAAQIFAAADTIFFYVAASGETGGEAAVSFPGAPAVSLRDDGAGGDTAADDGLYSALYIVPIGLSVADGEVTGSFIDAAGNSAVQAQAAQQLNIQTSTPPTAVTLAVGLVDSTTAHLTWTRSEDEDFASYRIYRSDTSDINVDADSLTITILTSRSTVSHDDYLSSSGTYYYRIFVFDAQELSSGSNEVVVTR